MPLFGNMVLTYGDTDDTWNSGYRDRTRSNRSRDNVVTDQVVAPDEYFTRSVANGLPDTAEYQALREVPRLAANLTRAINAGNTVEAQKIGDQFDAMAEKYSPYFTEWASVDERSLNPKSAVTKLISNARILNDGSWKTNPTDLSTLAGGATTLTTNYNDFINFDSEASINNRKAEFENKWKFDKNLSEILADRVTYKDNKHKMLRDLTEPYIKLANEVKDSVESLRTRGTMSGKVRMVNKMINSLSSLPVDVFDNGNLQNAASDLISAFMGTDPTSTNAPNLKEFQACAKSYFSMNNYDGDALDYAREWKNFVSQSANRTETRETSPGAGDKIPQIPVTYRTNTDVNTAAALTTMLVNRHNYAIGGDQGAALKALVQNVMNTMRALGFDSKDTGVTLQNWVDYAHYESLGQHPGEHFDSVNKVRKLLDTHRRVQRSLSTDLALADTTIGQGTGKEGTSPWLSVLAPVPNATRSAEQELAHAIAPKITSVLSKYNGEITRDQILDILKKSNSILMREIDRAPGSPSDKESLKSKIADYYYAKVSGDATLPGGAPLGAGNLRSLMDYTDTIIRKTHEIDAEGNKTSKLKEVPVIAPYEGDTKKDFITAVGASFLKPEGYKGPGVSEFLGSDTVNTRGFDEFIKTIYKVPTSTTGNIAYQYRENTVQPAGTKFLMNLAAKELDIPDEVMGLLKTKDGKDSRLLDTLTKMSRAQVNPVANFSTDSTWFGTGTDDIGLGDSGEAKERYREVFDFAMKLYNTGDAKATDTRTLGRQAFAEQIAFRTLLNLSRVDDTGFMSSVLSSPSSQPSHGSLSFSSQTSFNVNPRNFNFLKELRTSFSEDFAAEFDKWVSPKGDSKRSSSSDDAKDLNDYIIRQDARNHRLNNNYGQSFLKDYQVTLGKDFDPVNALAAAYARHTQNVKTQNQEQRHQDAVRTGGEAGVLDYALGTTMEVDDFYNRAIDRVVANAKRLNESFPSGILDAGYYRDNVLAETKDVFDKLKAALPTNPRAWRVFAGKIDEVTKDLIPVVIRDPNNKGALTVQVLKGRSLSEVFDNLPEATQNGYRGNKIRDGRNGVYKEVYERDLQQAKLEFIRDQSASLSQLKDQRRRTQKLEDSWAAAQGRANVVNPEE